MLLSGYQDGIKFDQEIKIKPYMFTRSTEKTKYKNMDGQYVNRIDFESAWEARQFIREHEQISNFDLYGSTYFDYVWIYDNYKDLVSDNSLVRKGNYDIETDSEGGYANIETADKEINSVTIEAISDNEIYCFGLKDVLPIQEILDEEGVKKNVIYILCRDERDLLLKFVETWQRLAFDVITGWNINGYDHVYMIRRLNRLFGDDYAKCLSPYNMIEEHKFMMFGKEQTHYDIVGIPTLDYMDCYKKFSFKNVESYKLDYISHLVLKKKKLDYSKYKTLARLYKENPALYYTYNIIDVVRVSELENELKFIDLIFSLSHFTRTNLQDAFATVKPCDVVIHNKMMETNTVIHHKKKETNEIERVIAGGYVKEVKPGLYPYIMSFDFTSLYPHIIMAYNISPDAYVGKIDKYDRVDNPDRIINERLYDELQEKLVTNDLCITAKGTIFSRAHKSYFAQIMEEVFDRRKEYKDVMLEEENTLEKIKGEILRRKLKVPGA
jgi:DNA polymerase elongation subunit (family B)